jgi:hypothetical protein
MKRAWAMLTQKEGGVVGGEEIRQSVHVVAAAANPVDVAQIEAVVDAVVGEGREVALVDGVPDSELCGDAVVEPVEDREAVASFGSGGEAQELGGLHVVEEGAVRGGFGVMELVHDHDVEVAWVEVIEASRVQALDGREDVVEAVGAVAAYPQFAEGWVAQGVAEGGDGLGEDFFSMGDEEEAGALERLSKAAVVDGGHDGLAGAGGGDEEVAVVALLA